MSYPFGQPVTLTLKTYSDAAGTVPADPTTVAIDILAPDGTESTHTWAGGDIVRVSTGVFTYTQTPSLAGHYACHWYTTGTVVTAEDTSFNVDAKYGQTFVPVSEFATYLNNQNLDETRAAMVLSQAQTLCESIVSPLPAGAEAVVLDVAERAFSNPTAIRDQGLGLYSEGQGPFSDGSPGHAGSGLFLTQTNIRTLRRLAGRGGAFTIDTIPSTADQNQPWWDTSITWAFGGDWDSPP